MKLAILGSTGSIGTSSLDVIARNKENFSIEILAAQSNDALLYQQCMDYKPKYAYLQNPESAARLKAKITDQGLSTIVFSNENELNLIISSSDVDIVIAGMVGIAGLGPVSSAIAGGKKILLANKESYVVAGEYLNRLSKTSGSLIFPLDSEHSAIHQCLTGFPQDKSNVSKIILTGSGGPFLNRNKGSFNKITPEEAINHPVWKMGKKISVDSSTMMNKGLEIIEARWLFGIEEIDIIVHPEGIIHSMVEFIDNSVIAQLSIPDMKIPIAYGLGFPDRIDSGSKKLDLVETGSLTFLKPDLEKFPCIKLSLDAMQSGGTAPALLNAANEEAVAAFLEKRITYLQIHEVISYVMDKIAINPVKDLESVFEANKLSRFLASERIDKI